MTPRSQALLRLYGVQASWTYERLSGIGVAHAAAPMLREHFANRPVEVRRAAVARSAEFFNSHPYLAGIAVGAIVKAERDGVPGPVISRLRTALSGPLGAIGDQLIWAGEVPALIGFTLALVPWFGIWAVLMAVIVHNVLRFRLTAWGLDLGLREGLEIGTALQRSWLPGRAEDAQRLAAFAIGLAMPLAAWGLLTGLPLRGSFVMLAVVVLASFLAVAPATRSRVTGLRVGLALLALALIFVGEFA